MVAMTATRTIQPTLIQKSGPSLFLVGSAASSAWTSCLISAMSSVMTLLTGNPRIDDGEQEVEDEVDQHDGDGDEEGDALHDRVVVLVHARDQLVAEAGHLQQEFDDEGPGDQAADGDARRGQEGDGRRAQGVTPHDAPVREALG